MKEYTLLTANVLAALACGQAHETVRALYGHNQPEKVKVILLCRDSRAHFEFKGMRRIFSLPSPVFEGLVREARSCYTGSHRS
jgi:hypothetical protein